MLSRQYERNEENKEYDICVWDILFCKKDEDGNEMLNEDGSIKLFQLKRDCDVSFIAEGTTDDELEEATNSLDDVIGILNDLKGVMPND